MADIFELFKKISKKEEPAGAPTHLLVGLGNPGRDYATTRHNAGFIAIDCICHQLDTEMKQIKFHSFVNNVTLGDHRTLLMTPQTMMNRSGIAVKEAMDYYNIPIENVIIIVDDINLDPGYMRIRKSGSAGGHNGLKSIIEMTESEDFPRIRIGVGQKPSKEYDLAAWVTGKISKEVFEVMRPCVEICKDAAIMIMDGETDKAMGKCNGMKPKTETNTEN